MNEKQEKRKKFTILVWESQYDFILDYVKKNDVKISSVIRKSIDLWRDSLCQETNSTIIK